MKSIAGAFIGTIAAAMVLSVFVPVVRVRFVNRKVPYGCGCPLCTEHGERSEKDGES